jgi:hypothetical protein
MLSLPEIVLTESEQIEVLEALVSPSLQKYLKAQVSFLAQDVVQFQSESIEANQAMRMLAKVQGQISAYEALLSLTVPPQPQDE